MTKNIGDEKKWGLTLNKNKENRLLSDDEDTIEVFIYIILTLSLDYQSKFV